VGRAAAKDLLAGGTAQGASTLTQQYVKNLLVDAATGRRSRLVVRGGGAEQLSRSRLHVVARLTVRRFAVAVELEGLPLVELGPGSGRGTASVCGLLCGRLSRTGGRMYRGGRGAFYRQIRHRHLLLL